MNDTTYRFFVGLVDAFLWGGELVGDENHLPEKGPAVFIANHLGPLGPIGAACSIPLRLYYWVMGDMVDKELAAEYLRVDFVEPRLKLKPPFSLSFSKALSRITVPLLSSLGCIPAYLGGQERLYDTLRLSLSLLLEEKYLLVFPEYAILGADSLTKMYPFQKTVFRLGEMYYEQTRRRLPFYPVAIHESRRVKVGQPFTYNPLVQLGQERHRLKDLLEEAVKKMYLELSGGDYLAASLAHYRNGSPTGTA